jgi:transposase
MGCGVIRVITAGDGLAAFGATIIQSVQAHRMVGRTTAWQWDSAQRDAGSPMTLIQTGYKERPRKVQPNQHQPRKETLARTLATPRNEPPPEG